MNARHTLVATLWLAGSLWCRSSTAQTCCKQAPPKLMLWSWFAEDDFRFLADREVGVAYLALSLHFEGQNQVVPWPRSIPVRIPPKMYQMAVIRFDNLFDAAHRPAFSQRQRELAVRMVAETAAITKPQGVQIDFDAPRSAWPFYRQLLSEIRARIGPDIFLSITGLVSWCDTAQSWLAGLPVDEIVPMAFSMGQATPATVTMLQRGGQFQFSGCRASIGIELPRFPDPPGHPFDPLIRPRKEQRAYFFLEFPKWSPEFVSRAQNAFLP